VRSRLLQSRLPGASKKPHLKDDGEVDRAAFRPTRTPPVQAPLFCFEVLLTVSPIARLRSSIVRTDLAIWRSQLDVEPYMSGHNLKGRLHRGFTILAPKLPARILMWHRLAGVAVRAHHSVREAVMHIDRGYVGQLARLHALAGTPAGPSAPTQASLRASRSREFPWRSVEHCVVCRRGRTMIRHAMAD
jgi:hypothetical protein